MRIGDIMKKFWTYAAPPTPSKPPPNCKMSRAEWEQLTPGYRRAIWEDYTERPCAAPGLTSYRYGSIMIGATSTRDALNEANRSLTHGVASIDRLEIWNAQTGLYDWVKV